MYMFTSYSSPHFFSSRYPEYIVDLSIPPLIIILVLMMIDPFSLAMHNRKVIDSQILTA